MSTQRQAILKIIDQGGDWKPREILNEIRRLKLCEIGGKRPEATVASHLSVMATMGYAVRRTAPNTYTRKDGP